MPSASDVIVKRDSYFGAFISPFSDKPPVSFYSSISIPRSKNPADCVKCALPNISEKFLEEFIYELSQTKKSVGFSSIAPPVVDSGTEVNIWFDDSGSMSETLAPLEEMRVTLLRSALLPAYNNDEALYNERVKILYMGLEMLSGYNAFEAGILAAAKPKSQPTLTKSVNLIFQDESTPYGAENSFDPNFRTAAYDNHVTVLRNSILGDAAIYSVIFQVSGHPGFKTFLQTTKACASAYQGIYGTCDLPRLEVNYDVNSGDSPAYYLNLILNKLRELGFANI